MKKLKSIGAVLASVVFAGTFALGISSCSSVIDDNKDDNVVIDISNPDKPILYKDPQNFKELYANLYIPTDKIGQLKVVDKNGRATYISDSQLNNLSRSATSDVGWHPLKKPVSLQTPKTEVLCVTDALNMYEENNNGYQNVGSGSYNDYKIVGVGDFDGDLRDEAFIIYYTGDGRRFSYRIFDKKNGTENSLSALTPMPSFSYTTGLASPWDSGMTSVEAVMSGEKFQDVIMAGDVNGDGKDELILTDGWKVLVYSVNVDANVVSLIQTLNPFKVSSMDGATKGNTAFDSIGQLVVADFDNDGIDDIITVAFNGVASELFKGSKSSSNPIQAGALFTPFTAAGWYSYTALDYDGDGVNELCYIDCFNFNIGIYSFQTNSNIINTNVKNCLSGDSSNQNHNKYARPIAADFDFDGKEEVFWGRDLIKIDETGVKKLGSVNFAKEKYSKRPFAGDYDGDGICDVYWANQNEAKTSGSNYVAVYKYNGSGLPEIAENHSLRNAGINPSKLGNEKFVVGNFDNDTKKLRYIGHELTFSDPQILAVLCAAPYYQDIVDSEKYDGYSPGDWETSFSSGSSKGEGQTHSWGVHAGVGVGFSVGIGKIAEAEMEVMLTANYNGSFSKSTTVSKEITFTGTASDDHVIFTSIPIDHFYYEIIDETPNSEVNGETVDITVPRDNSISNMSVKTYNERNGNFPDVVPRAHTVGQPRTYLTKAQAREKAYMPNKERSPDYRFIQENGSRAIYDDSNPLAGGNSNENTISVEQESTLSNGFEIDVTMSTEVSGGFFTKAKGKAEFGVSYGCDWENTTGKGTSFSGTIGAFPQSWADTHPNDIFESGIYVYNQDIYLANESVDIGKLQDGDVFKARKNSYWVVTYWVD